MTDTSRTSYGSYLDLERLLGAQHPISDHHDEMLFVIIHQTKELWLKQILHEVAQAQTLVRAGDLVPAYKSLARVSRIQSVMTMSWDILVICLRLVTGMRPGVIGVPYSRAER